MTVFWVVDCRTVRGRENCCNFTSVGICLFCKYFCIVVTSGLRTSHAPLAKMVVLEGTRTVVFLEWVA